MQLLFTGILCIHPNLRWVRWMAMNLAIFHLFAWCKSKYDGGKIVYKKLKPTDCNWVGLFLIARLLITQFASGTCFNKKKNKNIFYIFVYLIIKMCQMLYAESKNGFRVKTHSYWIELISTELTKCMQFKSIFKLCRSPRTNFEGTT